MGGNLNVCDNEKLTKLQGLDALTEVGNDMNIYGNDRLQSVASLAALTRIGGNFFVVDNPSLPTDQVEELAARVARRDVSILNNATSSTCSGSTTFDSMPSSSISNTSTAQPGMSNFLPFLP